MYSILFGEIGVIPRKITALLFCAAAIAIFSVYNEPVWGAWLPRWLYFIPRGISGTHTVPHYGGMLGAVYALILVVFLKLRGFLSDTDRSLFGVLLLIADAYALTLVFDIAFGDTSRFLQGGLTSMAAVAAFTVCVLGMRQYVALGLIVLCAMCVMNIISAESVLHLPGSFGIIFVFTSISLQCGNFFEKLGDAFSDIRGK